MKNSFRITGKVVMMIITIIIVLGLFFGCCLEKEDNQPTTKLYFEGKNFKVFKNLRNAHLIVCNSLGVELHDYCCNSTFGLLYYKNFQIQEIFDGKFLMVKCFHKYSKKWLFTLFDQEKARIGIKSTRKIKTSICSSPENSIIVESSGGAFILDENLETIKDIRNEEPINLAGAVPFFDVYLGLEKMNNGFFKATVQTGESSSKSFVMSAKNYQHSNPEFYLDIIYPFGQDFFGLKEVSSYLRNMTNKQKVSTGSGGGSAAGLLGLLPVLGGFSSSSSMVSKETAISELDHHYWFGFKISSETGKETGEYYVIQKETQNVIPVDEFLQNDIYKFVNR